MPSPFRFQSDRSLERSLLQVIESLRPRLAATDRDFRARIAKLNLSTGQKKALAELTPGAAVRVIDTGASPAEFFRKASEAGRTLALLNTKADVAARALGAYGKAAALDQAGNHLLCALVGALNQAFAGVLAAESAVLRQVLDSEGSAETTGELLGAFLRAAAKHFDARHGAVFTREDADTLRSVASVDGASGQTYSPGRLRLRQLGKRTSLAAPLEEGWSARSVWSAPIGEAILQLGFTDTRPQLPREAELLQLLAERCRLAMVRLERESGQQEISVRMLEVEELERRRISRELHDDSAQALAVIRLQLEMAELSVPQEAAELRGRLGEIRDLTERTIRSVRGLISDLSPAVLEQLGLPAAVRQLANRFKVDKAVRLRLYIGKLPRMHPRLEMVIYRVLQECFRNIGQHSQAEHINVSLTSSDGVLRLTVEDDGVGFDVQEAMARRNCYGLVGIRERVTLLGGTFLAESTNGGRGSGKHPRGTSVLVELPLTGDYPG